MALIIVIATLLCAAASSIWRHRFFQRDSLIWRRGFITRYRYNGWQRRLGILPATLRFTSFSLCHLLFFLLCLFHYAITLFQRLPRGAVQLLPFRQRKAFTSATTVITPLRLLRLFAISTLLIDCHSPSRAGCCLTLFSPYHDSSFFHAQRYAFMSLSASRRHDCIPAHHDFTPAAAMAGRSLASPRAIIAVMPDITPLVFVSAALSIYHHSTHTLLH